MHAISPHQDASTDTTHGRDRRFQVRIGHANAMATVAIAVLPHVLPATSSVVTPCDRHRRQRKPPAFARVNRRRRIPARRPAFPFLGD
ncbi:MULTISPECIES: hypothetical protein [Xanthomonas]|uniref:hypothetical protein n=1 Tax=Xanthomonas TaxID=338 RepID=UPI001ADC29D4|nr:MULTISPECIES: hypothetical protein [unclassified Xanthomonas]MBO9871974.1 hypothetical protein [Xanthomonas sp. D-93]WNH43118.1 hypothetical protein PG878_11210 [Xanthomonas sp. A6251]